MNDNIINEFRGEYGFLSNMYKTQVMYRDTIFSSAEHAYVAAKNFKYKDKVLEISRPGEVKRFGRTFPCRPDWDDIKFDTMAEIVKDKFNRNKSLSSLLLKTGNAVLIEGNWWHDNYWGNCFCEKCKNIPGKNNLGVILMNVRDELRERFIQKIINIIKKRKRQ